MIRGVNISIAPTFSHLQLSVHVPLHVVRQHGPTLHTTEGRALPHASRHQLEGTSADLLSRRCDADDAGLTPTLVARLKANEGTIHKEDLRTQERKGRQATIKERDAEGERIRKGEDKWTSGNVSDKGTKKRKS